MPLMRIKDEEINILLEKLENIKKFGSNEETIKDILTYLVPKNDKKPIGIEINKKLSAATFDLTNEKVKVSPERLNNVIKQSIIHLKRIFPEIDTKEMFNYYVLFALIHETRHVNQYLIAEGAIDFPYKIIKETYKAMSKIGYLDINFIRNYISLYMYNIHNKRLIIERNANIEATEIVHNLAKWLENEPIADLFESMRQRCITYGYDGNYNGSLEETYKTLYLKSLYNDLPKGEAIPVRDRILYGLPINEETREKVLAYKY